jgi:hypothetical protein
MYQLRALLFLTTSLAAVSAPVLATTTNNGFMVSANGAINKEAAVNTIQQQINNGNILQPGTGIMKTDPDTIIATGVAKQNSSAANTVTPTNNSVRTTVGIPQAQAQQLQQSVNASTGNSSLVDPDVQAAQKAAQSVTSTPAAATNPTTSNPVTK